MEKNGNDSRTTEFGVDFRVEEIFIGFHEAEVEFRLQVLNSV